MNEFAQISGYKVNFSKFEIMPMVIVKNCEPDFVGPFRWAPEELTYLGVKVTPEIGRLYVENVYPLIKHIRGKNS